VQDPQLERKTILLSSMRILHVIDSFSPECGGPPEAVKQLLKAYAAEGAGTDVVCLDRPDEPFLRDLPGEVHALGESYFGRFAFSPRLWRWMRAHAGEYDAIVMNGIWTFPGLAVCHAARRARKPYGIFAHGALDPWFSRQYPLKYVKKLIYWPLQYAVLHSAKVVFFTTTVERDLAKTSFQPNEWTSEVVPYGILAPEDSLERRSEQVEAFFQKLPEVRGRHYLLFLARMHEKKGCDLLLQAFAELRAMAPDVDLVIAGPDQGGMQAMLKQMAAELGIADRVHWPGMIGGDTKWGALRACDALVLPSHQENFGVAVVESLAVGRPVLISQQVNIWPEIEADGVGLTDEDTLKGTLRLLSRWFALAADERKAMADRTRACFKNRYSMKETAAVINGALSAVEPEIQRE
jgi:glycosyltransferase involved in cell wall biosynthesis